MDLLIWIVGILLFLRGWYLIERISSNLNDLAYRDGERYTKEILRLK